MIACALVLIQTSVVAAVARQALTNIAVFEGGFATLSTNLQYALMLVAVIATYAVLAIDRIAVRRARREAENAVEPDIPKLLHIRT